MAEKRVDTPAPAYADISPDVAAHNGIRASLAPAVENPPSPSAPETPPSAPETPPSAPANFDRGLAAMISAISDLALPKSAAQESTASDKPDDTLSGDENAYEINYAGFDLNDNDDDLLILNALQLGNRMFHSNLLKRLGICDGYTVEITNGQATFRPASAPTDVQNTDAGTANANAAEESGAQCCSDVETKQRPSGAPAAVAAAAIAVAEHVGNFGELATPEGTKYIFSWNERAREAMAGYHEASGPYVVGDNPMFISRILAHVMARRKYEHIYQQYKESLDVYVVYGLSSIVWSE